MTASTRGCRTQSDGIRGNRLAERAQAPHVDRGLHRLGPIRAQVFGPVHRVLVADEAECGARLRLALVQAVAILVHHGGGFRGGEHSLGSQLVGVQLARRRLLANDLVHERLGGRRLVAFVVAVAPVADQVNHHVLVKFHAVLERKSRDETHRLRIIGIDMEYRRFDHLRHVGAIKSGACIARIAGGETHLVVDDDVHRTARVEAARLRQLQRLHDDALSGECGVAVNLDRQDLVAGRIAAPLLPCAHRAFDDRVHHFQVRGIERQRDVHIARRGFQIGGKSLVVFDVARAAQLRQIVLTFELAEQILGGLAQQVHQHVEAAAMRHADDGLLHTELAAVLHEIIEQRYQAVAALERESLLPHVLGVQVTLQTFRGGQLPEDVLLLVRAEAALQARHLEIILQPQTLIGGRHVRELGADRIGVNEFQVRQYVFELGALGQRVIAAAGEEFRIQIGVGEPEILQIEHIGLGALLQPERIQIGGQVAPIRVNLDEARHRALFGARSARFPVLAARRRQSLARRQARANRRVCDLAGAAVLQTAKIGRPGRIHRIGILQELLVEILDEVGIAAGERRGG